MPRRGVFRRTWSRFLQLAAGAAARGFASTEPHSVVVILIDTLRRDFLGLYGFKGEISPNLDRLASESVVFDRCFSPAPWTKPAVASLFTSLYPEVHGVTNHDGQYWGGSTPQQRLGALPGQALTLAEALRADGCRTAAFVSNPWLVAKYGFGRGFDVYRDCANTPEIISAAGEWLGSLAAADRFFVYLHLMDAHAPYSAPRDDYQVLWSSLGLGEDRPLRDEEYQAIPPHLEGEPRLDDAERRRLSAWRAKYGAGVRAADRHLGCFLQQLRDSGALDRTLVVLTADHGEELLEHGGWDHGYTLYEELLHVPLLVRLPNGREGGRRVGDLVSLLDVMPTVLALLGVQVPSTLQGRLIRDLIARHPDDKSSVSFSSSILQRPGMHALRTPSHKLIVDLSRNDVLLFDLRSDPGELTNIAAHEPALARALRGRLLKHLGELAERPGLDRETTEISEELRQRLSGLGYLR